MTPADAHQTAQSRTKDAEATLMRWVTDAQRSLESDKLDGLARARLGELMLNACRYLSEREELYRKAAMVAQVRSVTANRDFAGLHRNS